MGTKTAEEIFQRLEKKTAQTSVAPAPERTEAPAPQVVVIRQDRKVQNARRGLTYTGYYINDQAKEQLRDLAYKTRREKQDLFREALNLLFEKYDMDVVTYASKDEDDQANGQS